MGGTSIKGEEAMNRQTARALARQKDGEKELGQEVTVEDAVSEQWQRRDIVRTFVEGLKVCLAAMQSDEPMTLEDEIQFRRSIEAFREDAKKHNITAEEIIGQIWPEGVEMAKDIFDPEDIHGEIVVRFADYVRGIPLRPQGRRADPHAHPADDGFDGLTAMVADEASEPVSALHICRRPPAGMTGGETPKGVARDEDGKFVPM